MLKQRVTEPKRRKMKVQDSQDFHRWMDKRSLKQVSILLCLYFTGKLVAIERRGVSNSVEDLFAPHVELQ